MASSFARSSENYVGTMMYLEMNKKGSKQDDSKNAPKVGKTKEAAAAAAVPAISSDPAVAKLQEEIAKQAQVVKDLKSSKADKEAITAAVNVLLELKAKLPADLQANTSNNKKSKKKKKDNNDGKKKDLTEEQRKVAEKARLKAEKAAAFGKAGSGKKKKEAKKKKLGLTDMTEENIVFVNKTPPGEKKDMTVPMDKAYNPPSVEASWDLWWEKKGFFKADVEAALKAPPEEKFIIVIPPPNVTGSLHIGHGLTCALEDTLCRWHRMLGHQVLWIPGVDHAGIATQAVVERMLWKTDKKTRHDLGREKFLEKVWEWKHEKGSRILTQLRRLGASVDHDRHVFTMDDIRSKAVLEAYCRMYDDGLIYRSTRLVNWSCHLNTAISDIEVDHEKIDKKTMKNVIGHDPKRKYEFGCITSFAYKVENPERPDDEVVVATTRLETMLGDVAVAVHPDDPRYKHLHGKFCVHPFNDRKIEIITDDVLVDMNFGTGAVKITPAHDPNDFECGRRHQLQEISIFNDNGSINHNGGKFEGMMRFDARYAIEEELKKLNLYRDKKDNEMTIPICSRSGDVIEPRLKPQWYVNCKTMAKRAVDAVKEGELKILPDSHDKTWFRWLDDCQDWCISRQLWWGHRIPAYYVKISDHPVLDKDDENNWVVGRDEAEAKERASKRFNVSVDRISVEQDEDVLDTWFSSGLFPFASFGWPEKSPDLDAFFPGTLLETGHDILFFWVARMVMMSLHLTDKLPFTTVYLHAMVRDKHGRKMSKALGNVIDPVHVIEGISLEDLHNTLYAGNLPESEIKKAIAGQKDGYPNGIPECGTDALRFGLLAYTIQSTNVNLDINRVEAYRKFCNKLWQVTKFLLLSLGDDFKPRSDFVSFAQTADGKKQLSLLDRWILSRLATTINTIDADFKQYAFAGVTTALFNFWMEDLCGTYVEAVKPVIYKGNDPVAKELACNVLWICLDFGLKLLHPIMPFVTEELWQRLPGKYEKVESIMVAQYPIPSLVASLEDEEACDSLDRATMVIKSIRSLLSIYKITKKGIPTYVSSTDPAEVELIKATLPVIDILSKSECKLLRMDEEAPLGCGTNVVSKTLKTFVMLKGVIDASAEIKRLRKERAAIDKGVTKLTTKMQSDGYAEKIPPQLKEKNDAKLAAYLKQQKEIDIEIVKFEELK